MLGELKAGKGDGEILKWIQATATHRRTEIEIFAWSQFSENRAPADVESHTHYAGLLNSIGPNREDLSTWFDVLDLDDHVSFGGPA